LCVPNEGVASKKNKKKRSNEVQNHSSQKLLKTLAILAMGCFAGAASAQDAKVTITTGGPDGKLGALSRPASLDKKETETADDFVLKQVTVINGASIVGLVNSGTPLANITNVEVEIYHIFPEDSVQPPSGNVPSRANSPSDVEIDSATRDTSKHTLAFNAKLLAVSFTAQQTVVNGIKKKPFNVTNGEPSQTGDEVEIEITFTSPIVLPAGHYFFRPEVQVTNSDFLFLSAPRPIVAPGTPIPGDLQAWVRNSDLAPDWLRIGTDIIAGNPPTFNMSFSLGGTALVAPGTPGHANCEGQTVSGLANQFGGMDTAATTLGFSSVTALHNAVGIFCAP